MFQVIESRWMVSRVTFFLLGKTLNASTQTINPASHWPLEFRDYSWSSRPSSFSSANLFTSWNRWREMYLVPWRALSFSLSKQRSLELNLNTGSTRPWTSTHLRSFTTRKSCCESSFYSFLYLSIGHSTNNKHHVGHFKLLRDQYYKALSMYQMAQLIIAKFRCVI